MYELIMGVDIGTHGVRIIIIDENLNILAKNRVNFERIAGMEGIQEQYASNWKDAFIQAVKGLLTREDIKVENIRRIGITHQRGTVVPVDNNNQTLARAVCDSDTRCLPEVMKAIESGLSEKLYKETGCPPFPFVGSYKIAWFKEERYDIYRKAKKWLSPQDYVVGFLTGSLKVSAGSLSRLGLLNIVTREKPSLLTREWLDLSWPDKKDIVPVGSIMGLVSSVASAETGLPSGIPVIACPGDQASALAGCGAVRDGDIGINMGTSFVITQVLDRPIFDPQAEATLELAVNGNWAMDIGTGSGTNALDWLGKIISKEELNWGELTEMAKEHYGNLTSFYVLPLWWKLEKDSSYGAILGLNSYVSREKLFLAFLEGLVFETYLSLEKINKITGRNINMLHLFGGASQNYLLVRMLATLTNVSCAVASESDSSGVGAAITALVESGLAEWKDIKKTEFTSFIFDPEPKFENYLKDRFVKYRELRNNLPHLN